MHKKYAVMLVVVVSLVFLSFVRRRYRVRLTQKLRSLSEVAVGSMLVFVRNRRVFGVGPYVEHTAIYVGGPNHEVIEISDDGRGEAVLLRRPVIKSIKQDDKGFYVYSYPAFQETPGCAAERALAEWESQHDARDYCFKDQNCQHWCSKIVYGCSMSHTKQLCLWLRNPLFESKIEVVYEPISHPEAFLNILPTRSPVAGPLHTLNYVWTAMRLHQDTKVLRTVLLANEAQWAIALLAAKRYNVVGQSFERRDPPYDSLQAVLDVVGTRVQRIGVRVKLLHLALPILLNVVA
jgi:hypothetical protein